MFDNTFNFGSEFDRAEDLNAQGEFHQAFEVYMNILRQTLQSNTAFTRYHTVVVDRLGNLATLFGLPDMADKLFAGLASLAVKYDDLYMRDYATIKRAMLWVGHGKLRVARTHLNDLQASIGNLAAIDFSQLAQWERGIKWRANTPGDRAVIFTQLYATLGRVLTGVGQYRDAVRCFDRGIEYSRRERVPSAASNAEMPLSLYRVQALLELGDFEEVASDLSEIHPAIEPKRHPAFLILWHELNAQLGLLQGDFGQMLEDFREVFKIARRGNYVQSQLNAMVNLANAHVRLNQINLAIQSLEWVQNNARRVNNQEVYSRATYLLQIAQMRLNSMADGVEFVPTVSEMQYGRQQAQPDNTSTPSQLDPFSIPQGGNYLALFEDRVLGFYWNLSRFDIDGAAKVLQRLDMTFKLSDSKLIHLRLRMLEAFLKYYQGNYAAAEPLLRAVRKDFEDQNLTPEQWQVQRILVWCWMRQGKPESEIQLLVDANEQLLANMTQTLPVEMQSIFLLNKWSADEEYLASQINRLVVQKREMLQTKGIRRLVKRWHLMSAIYDFLHYLDDYRQVRANQVVEPESPQDEEDKRERLPLWRFLLQQPRKQARVSYIALPDRLFIGVSRRFHLDFAVNPLTRVQLRTRVQNWHETVAQVTSAHTGRSLFILDDDSEEEAAPQRPSEADIMARCHEISSDLGQSLSLPGIVDSLPDTIETLTIIPDDTLYGFPFAAVRNHDRYLIEDYACAIDFSSLPSSRRRNPVITDMAVVGVSRGNDEYIPLMGVDDEFRYIGEWVESLEVDLHSLHNNTATRDAVLRELSQTTFAHIACHGMFDRANPNTSGLVMIPEPNRTEVVSLHDFSRTDLNHIQHITLSSCWSADHFVLPGRFVVSLPEILYRAGVSSILGSLWEVDDNFSVSFMEQFYENLLTHTQQEALRQAQLSCINNTMTIDSVNSKHPIYWACFVVYGNTQKLRFHQKKV